jgi:hypothetical protein
LLEASGRRLALSVVALERVLLETSCFVDDADQLSLADDRARALMRCE